MSNPLELNPYSVSSSTMAKTIDSDFESIRKMHLSHEASVKSIGLLYWLGGILGSFMTLVYLGGGVINVLDPNNVGVGLLLIVIAVIVGCLSAFQIMVGIGLSKLQPWSRIAATVLSCIGLLGIPIGTLISAYFLYLLLSSKGLFVFSNEYKEVMAATPHIKYKTSIIVWIFLALLFGLIAIGIVGLVAVGVTS